MHAFALNETPKKQGSILRHGRGFLHFKKWEWGAEWSFFDGPRCHAYMKFNRSGDDVICASIAIPFLASLWLHVTVPYSHWLHRCVERIVPKDYSDERECGFSIHDWTIWLHVWSKTMEWCRTDPWYARDLTVNIPDLLLGRSAYTKLNIGDPVPFVVALDDRWYKGTIQAHHQTWKRPRWFRPRTRIGSTVDMIDPIPIPGKGENSYDCGEDALCGTGSNSTDPRVVSTEIIDSVCKTRLRYGGPNWQPAALAS